MRPCLFLDRDGVINEAPPPGRYILSPDELRLIPAVADWIRLFRTAGYLVIVVTNQRCVGRGLLTERNLERIHQRMRAELESAGAPLDDVFCCPHEKGTCHCRKPQAGMVLQAAARWGIELERSLMVGDSVIDAELAARCGMAFAAAGGGRIVDTPESWVALPTGGIR